MTLTLEGIFLIVTADNGTILGTLRRRDNEFTLWRIELLIVGLTS